MANKTIGLRLSEKLINELKTTAESLGVGHTEFMKMVLADAIISYNDRRERANLTTKEPKKIPLIKTLSPIEKQRFADLKDYLTQADKITTEGDILTVKIRPRRKDGTLIENYNGYATTAELKTAELEKYELLSLFQEKALKVNPGTEAWEASLKPKA